MPPTIKQEEAARREAEEARRRRESGPPARPPALPEAGIGDYLDRNLSGFVGGPRSLDTPTEAERLQRNAEEFTNRRALQSRVQPPDTPRTPPVGSGPPRRDVSSPPDTPLRPPVVGVPVAPSITEAYNAARGASGAPPAPLSTPSRKADRSDPAVALGTAAGADRETKTPQKQPAPAASTYPGGDGTPSTPTDGRGIPYRMPGSPGYDAGSLPLMEKQPDGRIVSTPRAAELGLKVESAGPLDPKLEAARFMAGRASRPSDSSTGAGDRPFSEALRAEPMPTTGGFDLANKGTNWTFSGGIGTGQAREGTRALSGLENRLALRDFREGRVRQEQGREATDLAVDVNRAKADYAMRMAQMDPLAMARIQAEGRYGGDVMKARVEAAAREAAYGEYVQAVEAAFKVPAGAERDQLLQIAREKASILLGNQYQFPRQDPMAAMLALMGMGGPGAAAGQAPK